MSTRRITYPPARKADIVDDYHGISIADPYQWLEDDHSVETHDWIRAQNELTRSTLNGPMRASLVQQLTSLYDFPRTSVPSNAPGRYFFTRNRGLQNQPVLYVQDGPDGSRGVLLDPNLLSDAGTTRAHRRSGERGRHAPGVRVRRTAAAIGRRSSSATSLGPDLPDRLDWAKFTSIAWTKDGSGFYYTRFPAPGTVAPGDENYFNKPITIDSARQARDRLVFERPDQREIVFEVAISADDRWVVLTSSQGSSDKCEVHLLDRQ